MQLGRRRIEQRRQIREQQRFARGMVLPHGGDECCRRLSQQQARRIEQRLRQTIADGSMQQMTVNTQLVKETRVRQERINVTTFQSRLDVVVEERNEVFSQEQWVTTACT